MQTINYSFTKSNKLTNSSDFQSVFTSGKKIRTKFVTIYSKHNELGRPRLGLVVAKKNIRLATRRNKIKRIARESFRNHKPLLNSLDIILVFNHLTNTLDTIYLKNYLDKEWGNLANC